MTSFFLLLKKNFMRHFFFILLSVTLFFSCKNKTVKKEKQEITGKPDSTLITTAKEDKDTVLLNLTSQVLSAFKNRNYDSIILFIHPDKGTRFSPYGYIDTALDKIISADWIREQAGKKKQDKLLWGEYDGSGDPIRMTFNEYVKEFVYDAEFLSPQSSKVNGFIGGGNSQNNLLSVYEGCDFTESHFSGFDPKFDGMDWKSLRLVFKLINGKYYLAGVVHDEWTI